jgi:hypothetical protein
MGVFSSAQPADADKPIENPPYATAFFTANVGAFKILSRGPTPAQGTLTMTFAGTILVSGLQSGGKVTTSGNVRREYDNAQYGKQVYFGRGQITISGKFSGIQWFGRDMSAKFTGYAIARLFGEFDKKLETGRWWYADEPDKKRYWNPNGANQVSIPKDTAFQQARPAPGKRSKDD